MKHTYDVLEKILGRIEVEKMSIANSRGRMAALDSEIQELAYTCDNAHSELVDATESIRSAIGALGKEA